MEFHSRYDGFYGAFLHDPLAVAAALDPTLIRTEAVTVDVELGGTLTTGETVTDWRRTWGRPPNVDVAVSADADRFLERLVERVGGLAEARQGLASNRADVAP
jgi:purine nucleosidase